MALWTEEESSGNFLRFDVWAAERMGGWAGGMGGGDTPTPL